MLGKQKPRWLGLALIAVTSLLIMGCGDGSVSASGSTTEAKVTGTVMILGKPATDGEVVFDPANVNRRDASVHRAPIDKDGHYTITTLVGQNMAIVEGPAIVKNGLMVANRQAVELTAGENTVDLTVPRTTSSTAPASKKPGSRR